MFFVRYSVGDNPFSCRKNFHRAFAALKPQKLAVEAMSCPVLDSSSFARSSLTDWISSRMECPTICRNRTSAIRREHLNAVTTSADEMPSQALLRISSIAAVTSGSYRTEAGDVVS